MQQQKERREGEQRRPGQAKPQPINFRGKDIPAPALCMEIKCLGQRRKTKQQNRPVTVSLCQPKEKQPKDKQRHHGKNGCRECAFRRISPLSFSRYAAVRKEQKRERLFCFLCRFQRHRFSRTVFRQHKDGIAQRFPVPCLHTA